MRLLMHQMGLEPLAAFVVLWVVLVSVGPCNSHDYLFIAWPRSSMLKSHICRHVNLNMTLVDYLQAFASRHL